MYEANETPKRWSEELACAILNTFSEEQVAALAVADETESALDRAGSDNGGRRELAARSLADAALCAAIRQAWRDAHPEVVAAAELISLDGSAEQCEALVRHFGAETILLELITDQHDDGWTLAEWTVDNVKNDNLRRELAVLLDRWKQSAAGTKREAAADATTRIVIFGGHPRDERKMNRRLFDNSTFVVRWKPCEKSQGSPDDKDLNAAMAHADAVILVTSMVSHNIMRIVKRFTQECDIPLKMVGKATDQQLRAVLAELFPDRALPGE